MDLQIGDRVRVKPQSKSVWAPSRQEFIGKEGVIERDPGDFGVRFPGEVSLRWFLGDDLEKVGGGQ